MLVAEELESPTGMLYHRVFMTGIHVGQLAGAQLQQPQPDGDKHASRVVFAQRSIHRLQHFARGASPHRLGLDQALRRHHEQRRRNTLVRHIGDQQAQMVIVHHEEVVIVAADFPRRGHRGVDVKVWPLR